MNFFFQCAHERKGDIRNVKIGLCVAAEAENFQAEAVATCFRVAPQVAAPLQCSQDVARRTLRDSKLAADFRVGQAIAAVRRGFENIKGALNGSGKTGIRDGHGNS